MADIDSMRDLPFYFTCTLECMFEQEQYSIGLRSQGLHFAKAMYRQVPSNYRGLRGGHVGYKLALPTPCFDENTFFPLHAFKAEFLVGFFPEGLCPLGCRLGA